jgi:hypothetical protein
MTSGNFVITKKVSRNTSILDSTNGRRVGRGWEPKKNLVLGLCSRKTTLNSERITNTK